MLAGTSSWREAQLAAKDTCGSGGMGGQGWPGNTRALKSSFYCSLMACPVATPRAGGKLKVKGGAGERRLRGARLARGSEGWHYESCSSAGEWSAGLQNCGNLFWSPSSRAEPGRALGSEGRIETSLWEGWCSHSCGGEGHAAPWLCRLGAVPASILSHWAAGDDGISILTEALASVSSSTGCSCCW